MTGTPKDLQSINPDAGSHRIPTDPVELEASLRAARRCWDEYPYYERRYGARGLRFANSDGAWLATLTEFDGDGMERQLNWLAGVLAGRGMPSVLLERQLVLLHEELEAALPGRSALYGRLLRGASILHRAQTRFMEDATFEALSSAFDARAAACGKQGIPSCGAIVVGAVVDEAVGRAHALSSVRDWLVDAARFPPGWIALVNQAVADAQGSLRKA